jgi:hypothetical protein
VNPFFIGVGMFCSAFIFGPIVYFGTQPHQIPWTNLGLSLVGLLLMVLFRERRRA